jgi:ketosteroid isomerase-like protein
VRDDRPFLVWEEALRFVRTRELDGYAGVFAPDGVVELPFPLPGMPRGIEGREGIRQVLAPVWRAQKGSGSRIEKADRSIVHETHDPGLVVIEFDLQGVDASGVPYRLLYVHVVTVRDGRIAVLRDDADTSARRARASARPTEGRVRTQTPTSATDETGRDLVRRYFEIWQTGNLGRIDGILAAGYVDHAHPELAGRAGVAAAVRRFHESSPGASVTVDTLVSDGELVAARTTIRRTRAGEAVVVSGMAFFRVEEGRLAEQWSCYPRIA